MGTDIISIYIFLQFMRAIPRVARRGRDDRRRRRCTIYRRIILPLLKPAIATVVIIKGIAIYNEFYIPFLYMPSPDLGVDLDVAVPVQGPVRRPVGDHLGRRVIVIIPTLVVFLVLQRFIYNGFTAGATRK